MCAWVDCDSELALKEPMAVYKAAVVIDPSSYFGTRVLKYADKPWQGFSVIHIYGAFYVGCF